MVTVRLSLISAIKETTTEVAVRGLGDRQMRAQRKDQRSDLIPVIVAVMLAVVGQTFILFNDFGPGNNSKGSGNAGMITAAVVSRAGAIETPPDPLASRPVS
jgi:hypothetical protein